ncbi:heme-binding protein [Colwelliaceae bacterium 6441]
MRGIHYHQAAATIELALSTARKSNYPPISVVILDSGGHIKACASEDGVGILRHEIAKGKAYASIGMSVDTRDLQQLNQQGILSTEFIGSVAAASHGKFNVNPGGAMIKERGSVIGAIGISGGSAQQDELLIRTLLSAF